MTLIADLSGKRALVTGASSEGFGRYFAKFLTEAGAEVVASARRLEPLHELVAELNQGRELASAVVLDVTDAKHVKEVVEEFGPFDIVVNNAGASVLKPVLEQTEDDYDLVVNTNMKGVWHVARQCAAALIRANKPGSIINIASITGLRQVGGLTPYAASKAAVIQLTKQMALELARYNIRVNAIAAGYFSSDLNRDYFETESGHALVRRVPMRRLGSFADLKGPLLLLSSDMSAFMTGSVLAVDGGHLVSSL